MRNDAAKIMHGHQAAPIAAMNGERVHVIRPAPTNGNMT
jgi:hypothetical protein